MDISDYRLRQLAWAVVVLCALVFAAQAPLAFVDLPAVQDWGSSDQWGDAVFVVEVLAFPVVGLLVARQQPRNRIAWLLLAIGLAWAVSGLMDDYVGYALSLAPALPAPKVVAALNAGMWVPGIGLMATYVILLFPDGRLPSPRWRVVAWASAVVMVIVYFAIILSPGKMDDTPFPHSDNPLGVEALAPVITVAFVFLAALPLCIVACALGLVMRFRRSTGVERVQLKWLATAGGVIALLYLLTMATTMVDALTLQKVGQEGDSGLLLILQNVSIASFILIPIAIGIAILRHGLYGIDALISKALVFGTLAVFITAVYVAIVVGIGVLVGQRHPSVGLSFLATAIVAVAFQPVRERVQRMANRLVYGRRATPYEVLSDFASRVTGRYTLPELLPQLARTVAEGLGARRVEVWVTEEGHLSREASWPAPATDGPATVATPDEAVLPDLPVNRVAPVLHHDELLGLIAVQKASGDPVTPSEDKMLRDVASQAGLVLRNVRLLEDVRASRQRLVSAQDEERRRLERNLHDGAQQSLVSVALLLRMAAGKVPTGQADLSRQLEQASQQLQAAIDELRELARGIHPAVLTERGLGPALTGLAERCPVPVTVDVQLDQRLPATIEGTVYFVVAEALTNVVRYARARVVSIRVQTTDSVVHATVSDDGIGGADARRGSGLRGLADRVAAVAGSLAVDSRAGGGTTVSCEIPLPPRPEPAAAQSPVLVRGTER